jgi:hypothetical protein
MSNENENENENENAFLYVFVFIYIQYLISCASLCLLKILAKDRMVRKKFLSYKVGTHFGLDFEEAQALTTYQLLHSPIFQFGVRKGIRVGSKELIKTHVFSPCEKVKDSPWPWHQLCNPAICTKDSPILIVFPSFSIFLLLFSKI